MKTNHRLFTAAIIAASAIQGAFAQTATTNQPASGIRTNLMIEVTARKWVEPLQSVPGAVTIQTADTLERSGVQNLRDAARYIPNLTLSDFSVRRLTFPFMRGIGSGRNSPAVTTCIDGVPQLSYVTANQQLIDVDRIEFLRGSQGALYGRNTLGGVINILPRQPTRDPETVVSLSGGDYGLFTTRVSSGGPIGTGTAAGSIGAGYSRRDGFTINDMTGRDVDNNSAWFGRAQILWPDQGPWRLRLSVSGERDRDGDYTLYDLASIRERPHHIMRDYEGGSDRDILQPALTALYSGSDIDITSITAFQWWKSYDRTDLDATGADMIRRENKEDQRAWTEELRISSPAESPVRLADSLTLRWLVGAFLFDSAYSQRAFNDYRADAVSMLGLPFPYRQYDDADLDAYGASIFGHATITMRERMELGIGLRHDYEHRSADLSGYADPALMPPSSTTASENFNRASPRATLAFHLTPDALVYVEAAGGYKAGGFNTQSLPDQTTFDEETSQTYESGLKTSWFHDRLVANAALFLIDWDNLQMDVPLESAPGVFYIDNAGRARSMGGELEMTLRPIPGLDLFGGIGLLTSEFRPGSTSGGIDVSGNALPFAPRTSWHAGMEYSQLLSGSVRGSARLEAIGTGSYYYDAANSVSQSGYTLANVRLGISAGAWRVEGWINNLFDKDYVPIALPYPLAKSGYIGENGAPRTIGASVSRAF